MIALLSARPAVWARKDIGSYLLSLLDGFFQSKGDVWLKLTGRKQSRYSTG
jgi:hypothetical protein